LCNHSLVGIYWLDLRIFGLVYQNELSQPDIPQSNLQNNHTHGLGCHEASSVALMSVTILVLFLWTALEPPSWQREVSLAVDPFVGRDVESKGTCNYKGGLSYVSMLSIVFFWRFSLCML
jgi:hypothetical protein